MPVRDHRRRARSRRRSALSLSLLGAAALVRALRASRLNPFARELIAGVVSLAPAVLTLRGGALGGPLRESYSIGFTYADCAVDDARPDRWGERVIRAIDRPERLSLMEFLYYAGDDRFATFTAISNG